MGNCQLQEVFVAGFREFAQGRELHPRESNVGRCITQCYTPALGVHRQYCEQGDFERLQYHACRHRSCPKCGPYARQAWIEAQLQRLLPCPHFHVIFTLPHSLLQLWEHNRTWFIGALFDCASRSLQQLMADPQHLGAVPGLMMALHTWGRDLSRHPHLHCLVSAGGIDPEGKWRSTRPSQLVPYKPLHNLFRGKLLARLRLALKRGQLQLPPWLSESDCGQQLRRLYAKSWHVRIEPQYEHGKGLTLYLARYAKGGPLPPGRTLRMQDNTVQMPYNSHRDHKVHTLSLSVPQFIERFVWHAPPRGVHTIRHAGLYSTPYRRQYALARAALSAPVQPPRWPRPQPSQQQPRTDPCPNCGKPLQRQLLTRQAAWRRSPNRVRRSANSITAGQPAPNATGPPAKTANAAPPRARDVQPFVQADP